MQTPNVRRTAKIVFNAIIFILIVAAAFWLGNSASQNETIKNLVSEYGYWGLFLAAVISGINVVVPIPAISFLPLFVEAGHLFWPTIAVIVLGVTLGDGVGYLIGLAGRNLISEKTIQRMERLNRLKKQFHIAPLIILFLFASVAPIPNEVIVIPLAMLGYKWFEMLPAILVGNTIFNTLSAFGVVNLFEALF